ncbi:MAG: hypothetical protein Q8O43_05885 [Dehalococcoidia bacterium]|nr:hypothetical protein [Dehalococcoidia bacterium]
MAMGSEIRELNNNTIKLETLKNLMSFSPTYLGDIDTLIFQPLNPIPAVSVDCEGDILLRIDPKTREIVGVEIEDFEGYFITKYPAFAPIWKQMKGVIKKNKCGNENLTVFLTIVQELLKELVNNQGCVRLMPSLSASQSPLL